MNHMIHIAAVTQLRLATEGRAYYRRKRADGKKPMEAMRCLKRRISDAVYRQLVADAQRAALTASTCAGPGGHSGATLTSSAVDLPPHIDTSDQPLPGPAKPTLQPVKGAGKTTAERSLAERVDNRGEPKRRTHIAAWSGSAPTAATGRCPRACASGSSSRNVWHGENLRQ